MPVFLDAFQRDERPELTTAPARYSNGSDQGRVSLRQVFNAGRQEAVYRGNLDADKERHREAYRRRIAALRPLAGNMVGYTLRNPEDVWDENASAARMQGGAWTIQRQRRIFADMLDKLAATRQDIDPRLTAPIDQDVINVGLEASAYAQELVDRRSHDSNHQNMDTSLAALAGGFVGSLSDPTAIPQFIAGILSGGTSLVGKNLAQQALITGAREATAGAVLETSVAGVRLNNERALGRDLALPTFDDLKRGEFRDIRAVAGDVAGNVGGAAIGGALIGGAGEVVGAGVRKLFTGRALPMNEPVMIEPTRPNRVPDNQPDMPDGLARLIDAGEPDRRLDAPQALETDIDTGQTPAQSFAADDGVRPFGFIAPDSDRLVDWEAAFGDSEVPPAMRAALGVIEAENASVAASRATPAPYRVTDSDAVRAIEKAYLALEMGEPMPAPALPRRYADLPEGADASMPMHPDEALGAAAIYRSTGELPALAAGDPVLLDQIEALARLSNATFDQVGRGDLPEDMGAVIGELAWNRPDTHQELSAMLIDDNVTDAVVAREMVSTRLEEMTPDVSGALLGVRALPVLPAIDLATVQPVKLADALRRAAPALPRSLDDLDVMTPLESARAFAERAAQEQLQQTAAIAKRKPDPDMLDGDWKERVAATRASALRDLAILDKGGLPESGYQALDDVMRARGKAVVPKRRAQPIEVGNDAAIQQGKDAAVAGGVDDGARIAQAQRAVMALEGVSVDGIGVHGPRISGLGGNWAQGRAVLGRLQDGDLIGAFAHPAINGATIDMPWGRASPDRQGNFGLAKILMHHPEVADNLDAILSGLSIDPKQNGPNRMRLTDGKYVVMVRKDADGVPKNWVLTAFELEANIKRTDSDVAKQDLAGSPNTPLSTVIPPTTPKINDDTQLDLIDMVVDPDGIAGDVDNPGAMTARDAAKVAARDDFMVERFRGCIL